MAVNVVLIVVFAGLITIALGLDAASVNNVGIYGGHDISIEQAPFMASLRLNGTDHYCGASVIHERFILTAAHCILPDRKYTVQVGTTYANDGGQVYDVEKIMKHEMYNYTTHDYDICLIKLKTNLTFSAKVNKIDLADRSVRLKQNIQVEVTGWGATSADGDISNNLQQVTIPIISTFSCCLKYLKVRHAITSRMFCAGEQGKDSCQGDSGGPLTLNNVQVGVTSFGSGCGKLPGVYTKISAMLPWINDNIKKNL
ncbi:trypsin 5G1 [Manduca sexta]|uniref:trypsin n=1 Tax=Manduca sexta TaxID=7130 RepID=O44332_MANSE|nr:trypsin 5G1 [Manduca sexta]AAB94559.1 hemocyte protease-3 [Manduca sexta]KAG6449795.1 hypothetical protein O3G_MSEX006223 [Manduca sexta]KAG6449796.1 hypothetical protein O3G_MSEX006223 [Manduca sexta]